MNGKQSLRLRDALAQSYSDRLDKKDNNKLIAAGQKYGVDANLTNNFLGQNTQAQNSFVQISRNSINNQSAATGRLVEISREANERGKSFRKVGERQEEKITPVEMPNLNFFKKENAEIEIRLMHYFKSTE